MRSANWSKVPQRDSSAGMGLAAIQAAAGILIEVDARIDHLVHVGDAESGCGLGAGGGLLGQGAYREEREEQEQAHV